MSLSVRMIGLLSGQELEAVRISSSATANIKANIAVQLPTGKRVQNHYPANLTLWELLVQVEAASGVPITKVEDPSTGKYMIPSLTVMNREFATLQVLKESTLYSIGASKAPILFRLRFKPSTLTLAQVLEQEEEALKTKEAANKEAEEKKEAKKEVVMEKVPVETAKEPEKALEKEPENKEVKLDDQQSMEVEKKEEANKEDDKMEVENDFKKDDEDVDMKDKEISETERERIIQEYLKKYQLTDKDLQKFNEEQAKAQLQKQKIINEEEKEAKKQSPPAQASASSTTKTSEGNNGTGYDPYGTATDDDVPEEEREVRVFSPSKCDYNPADYDLPDSFYELTPEDLKALRKDAAREAEEERTLMTREMRERRARARCKVFERCRIRIRFPDMVELQRIFLPNAKVGAIFRVVRESLADPSAEFTLYTTPPKRMLDNQEITLAKRGLVPATIVYIKFKNPDIVTTKYLKPELEAKIMARNEIVKPVQQQVQKGQNGGGHVLTDAHYCAMCMGSVGLDRCLECDNYYCRKCWKEVHKDGAMAEHHKTSMPSGPVGGGGHSSSGSSDGGKKKHNMNEEEKKKYVPKWFKLGKQ